MSDSVTADLDNYQRGLDKAAAEHDQIFCRAQAISRDYWRRGLVLAWEICHQEAEREFDHQAEGPDREGE